MILTSFKINKTLIWIFMLTALLILSFLVIFKCKKTDSDIKSLNKICTLVEKSNYDLNTSIKDSTLDTNAAQDNIQNSITSLNDSLTQIDELKVTNDYNNELKKNLKALVNDNIKLLELSDLIIKNKSYDQVSKAFSEYSSALEKIKNDYKSLDSSKLKINLTEKSLTFYNSIYSYGNTLIKISRDSDICFDQQRSFFLNLKETINYLESISDNLEPVIVDIYENNRSLDSLSLDVNHKKDAITKLKYQAANYSVPIDCKENYDKLLETINAYDIYITSFEQSLANHKNCIGQYDMSDIYSNYKDSLDKYSNYSNTFSEYKNMINLLN